MRSKPSGGAGPSTSAFSAHGFVSGVIAGGTGVLVGHGFDTLKVRSQVGAADGALSVAVLYRGILPPLITTGAARALYFGIFENAKRMLEPGVSEDALSLRSVGVAAAATGALTAPVTSPFVTLKLRQQVNGGSVAQVIRDVGSVGGFYRGFGVHGTLETIGSCVYLVTYVVAKRAMSGASGGGGAADGSGSKRESLLLRSCAGALAGMTAWTAIYPVDVLRSRIMSQPAGGGSALRAARECYAEGGLRAFWRGIGMTLLRAGPVAGVVLPVNDVLLDYLRTVF